MRPSNASLPLILCLLLVGLQGYDIAAVETAPPEQPAILSGPEFKVAPSSKENQRLPVTAYGAGVFLTVWQDGWNGVGGDSNILATRIKVGNPGAESADPKLVLDAQKPITICGAKDLQEAPQVAFANGVFLVVWQDFRNGKDADLYGARVTPEGKVLDPDGIAIAARPHNQNFPVLTHNDTDFLVLWQEVRYGQTYELMCSRIESKSGKVLDPKGKLLAKNVSAPSAAFTGKHYIIGWQNGGRRKKLLFCRYDANTLARVENDTIKVGHPDAFGNMGQMKFLSGNGEVVAIWARGIKPDPWGWGGPGAILSVRLKDDGSVPENKKFNKIRWSPVGREQYVKKLLPGVLDCANWAGYKGWPQGKPGGFKNATNGYWPHAYLAGGLLPGSDGDYFVIWVRAHLKGLGQTGKLDILGGRLKSGESLESLDHPATVLANHNEGSSTLPTITASEKDAPFLLVYERREKGERPHVAARFIQVARATK